MSEVSSASHPKQLWPDRFGERHPLMPKEFLDDGSPNEEYSDYSRKVRTISAANPTLHSTQMLRVNEKPSNEKPSEARIIEHIKPLMDGKIVSHYSSWCTSESDIKWVCLIIECADGKARRAWVEDLRGGPGHLDIELHYDNQLTTVR